LELLWGLVPFSFLFLASGLGDVLGASWKKSWFDGDVDRNALIPNVVN